MLQRKVLILQLILHFNDQLPQAAKLAARRFLLGQPTRGLKWFAKVLLRSVKPVNTTLSLDLLVQLSSEWFGKSRQF